MQTLEDVTLVLLGCGKMGSALLTGWLARGLSVANVHVIDPAPSDYLLGLQKQGLHLNQTLPATPTICVIAVKPQMMQAALPTLAAMGNGSTVFLSIAAGTSIATFEGILGAETPIVRAMPNTPAAIGKGITAFVGNKAVSTGQLTLAETLLSAVGETVALEAEAQMDAVTAVSGSGPAYVFHLIETLAQAGEAQGLNADMSLRLARATVAGAGLLAEADAAPPDELRRNVTSPGGTTAAALEVLMDPDHGFPDLLRRAVDAAAARSKALSG